MRRSGIVLAGVMAVALVGRAGAQQAIPVPEWSYAGPAEATVVSPPAAVAAAGLPAGRLAVWQAAPASPQVRWAGYSSLDEGGDQYLWQSGDGGWSWAAAAGLTAPVEALALTAGHPLWAAVATAAGVWISIDGGVTWAAGPPGLPEGAVQGLSFDSAATLWAVVVRAGESATGAELWKYPLGSSGLQIAFTAATPTTGAAGGTVTLQALVTDNGAALAGEAVTFSSSAGTWSASATSNASGVASATFPVPTTAGGLELLAVAGAITSNVTATLNFTVTALSASKMAMIAGAGQSQLAGSALALPLTVMVEDALGNGVSGQTVTFGDAGVNGGAGLVYGAFNPAAAVTGASGQASTSFTLPAAPGADALTAASDGLSVSWTETGTAAPGLVVVLSPPASLSLSQPFVVGVQVLGVGGYSGTATLQCLAPVPGCGAFVPNTVTAGGAAAALSINPAGFGADASSGTVTVQACAGSGCALSAQASLNLALPSFALSAAAGSAVAGAPVTLTVTAANSYTGALTFSATMADGSALPSNLSASFTPNPVTVTGAGASVTATFTDSTGTAAPPGRAPERRKGPRPPPAVWLAGLALLGLARGSARRRLGAVAFAACLAAGCGGGGPAAATTAVTVNAYPLTITASDGVRSSTLALTVTVN